MIRIDAKRDGKDAIISVKGHATPELCSAVSAIEYMLESALLNLSGCAPYVDRDTEKGETTMRVYGIDERDTDLLAQAAFIGWLQIEMVSVGQVEVDTGDLFG